MWECDEHEGTGSQLWTTPTLPGCCGVYGNSGIWIMRSRKAADYAYFIANALFPVTTNADEVHQTTLYTCKVHALDSNQN